MFQENVLNPSTFCVTWEQIPGRGAVERQQEDIIINAEKARQSGKIHAIGITDNPGGNPALAVDLLCAELKRTGMEPLVHFACRDKNRNAIESMLYGLERSQARNLLLLSGDYPSNEGFGGTSRPVFDLDPVNALQLVAEMNKGFKYQNMGKPQQLTPTQFFAGVGISPFKASESELAGQYYKLRKKIAAGAKFAITQIGYDARKLHELLQWLKLNKFDLPVLANLFVLPFGAAKIMKANRIPGCVVPDGLLAKLEEESKAPDKGKGGRILRAAEFYAVAKGLGCAGAHIGGHNIPCDTVLEVVDRGEELSPNWRDLLAKFDYSSEPTFFYYYKRDEATTLNRPEESPRPEKAIRPLSYRFSKIMHWTLFDRESPLFPLIMAFVRFADKRPGVKKALGHFEHVMKVALFGCIDCGDCALFDIGYMCPMASCPKSQRNGPCGGSFNEWCEVHPNEQKCIWVQAYQRLKSDDGTSAIFDDKAIMPPCNWELWQTSSWLNYFLGRDHRKGKY
jgi:methylenetetrahydrofolate reductase (NADPH)